jgi:hypothetical protein
MTVEMLRYQIAWSVNANRLAGLLRSKTPAEQLAALEVIRAVKGPAVVGEVAACL